MTNYNSAFPLPFILDGATGTELSKRGMKESRLKGNYQGGGLPYGYKVVDKKVLIDEEKAETVRFIFEQYSIGVYVKDIINSLTARGVLYKGKPFAKNTVYNILKNEKYSGIYYHEDERVDNMYPKIIPTHVYDAVRRKVEKNRNGRRSTKAVYLFRHKMRCGYCGHPISADTGTARNGEVKRYYKCQGIKAYRNGCEQTVHSKEDLENLVISAIIKELSKPQVINGIVKNLLKVQERYCAENPKLKTITREKNKVDTALDNLLSAIEQGIVSKTTNKRLHELEEQQEALERELIIERSKASVKMSESFIREYYEEALRLEGPMIINMLVKEIVLYNERIEIYFNSPIKNCPDESQGFSFYKGFIRLQSTSDTVLEMFVL